MDPQPNQEIPLSMIFDGRNPWSDAAHAPPLTRPDPGPAPAADAPAADAMEPHDRTMA